MAVAPLNPESIVWTDEEAHYLRAVMSWESMRVGEGQRRKKVNVAAAKPVKPPVGEFRILVIGAKGVGKTSILTRVCLSPRSSSLKAPPLFGMLTPQ